MYAAIGRRLDVLDPISPSQPVRLGHVLFPWYLSALEVAPPFAYVISGGQLYVADVTEPTSPRIVGQSKTLHVGNSEDGLVVNGDVAYAMRFDAPPAMYVIDVVDPTSPTLVATYDLPKAAIDIAGLLADHLYLLREGGGLFVVDVTAPRAPILVAETLLSEVFHDLDFGGDVAVAAIAGREFTTLDFADPLSPGILGSSDALRDVRGVRARGSRAVAIKGRSYGEFGLFSLSNPAAPAIDFSGFDEFGFNRAALGDHYFALSSTFHSIQLFGNPFLSIAYPAGRYQDSHWLNGEIAAEGEHLFIPSDDTLKIVHVAAPGGPATVAVYQLPPFEIPGYTAPDTAHHVIVADGYAYLTSQLAGLTILDVSAPRSPRVVNVLNGPAGIARIRDGLAFTKGDWFRIFDLADPSNPQLLGGVELPTAAGWVEVDGPLACAVGYGMMHVIDVSDPTTPSVLASTPVAEYATGLGLHQGYAYYSAFGQRIRAYDLRDPYNPRSAFLRGEFSYRSAGGLHVKDGFIYAAVSGGVWIGDLSNPLEPALIARQNSASLPNGFGLLNGFAAASHYGSGINIVPLFLPGDVDQDGSIDLLDLARLLSLFGQFVGGGPENADFDCDGWVDMDDLTTLLAAFGNDD